MKKLLAIVAALVIIAAASFAAGRAAGIRHAIEDAEIFTVECYDPDNPGENARPDGTDQTIYIILDDQIYEHGMFQG